MEEIGSILILDIQEKIRDIFRAISDSEGFLALQFRAKISSTFV